MGANAAVIEVSPGTDTLQTAIQSSAPGDVLVLEEGIYSWSGDAAKPFTIFHDLTIRGENSSTKPIIDVVEKNPPTRTVKTINFSGSNTEVVFQNITFTSIAEANSQISVTPIKSFTAIDCDHTIGWRFEIESQNQPSRTTNISFIGGTTSSNGSDWDLFASQQIVVAGMVFNNTDFDVLADGKGFYFIGNEYNTAGWLDTDDGAIRLWAGMHNIFGNSFNQDYSSAASTSTAALTGDDARPLIGAYSLSNIDIRNNTFSLGQNKLGNLGSPRSSVAVYVNESSTSLHITNNVFHHETANTTTGSLRPTIDVELGMLDTQLVFTNNIVIGNSYPALDEGVTYSQFELTNNLCQGILPANNNCGENQIVANPSFNNLTTFTLNPNSPAIDAGTEGVRYLDLDGTTNDIGAYGGPFSIEQFRVQREPGRTQPYLYPLINSQDTLNANGEIRVRAIAVARSK
jgi:hypothetical protein